MKSRPAIADDSEETRPLRVRVVAAGERLFRSNGYAAVSMDTIASELGVSKKTLYTAVRSKEEILSEIIEDSLRRISAQIDVLFDERDVRFVDKAAQWFVYLRFIHDTVTPIDLVRDIRRNAPTAWNLVRAHARRRTERIAAFFASGIASGSVRKDLDARILARLYSSCSAGILDESGLTGVRLQRRRAFEVFGRVFYTGMFTAEARENIQKVKDLRPTDTIHVRVPTMSVGTDTVRERILHAGRMHFFRFGYGKVRMDEIAAETGISKKTLYNHFASKEDLLREVLRDFSGSIAASTLDVSDESVFEYVRSLRSFVVSMADRLSEITPQFIRDLMRSAPAFFQELQAWRSDSIDDRFATVLRKGQRIGAIRSDVAAAHLARVYRIVLDSALRPEELAQDNIPPVDMYRTIVNVLFIGCLEDCDHRPFIDAYARRSTVGTSVQSSSRAIRTPKRTATKERNKRTTARSTHAH
ncbi:MAG: TetR/AcrR family transcriptional regulator [Candidatus Kapaibacterium sp.]